MKFLTVFFIVVPGILIAQSKVPSFTDFPAAISTTFKKAILDFKSNQAALLYRSQIRDQYKNKAVNFGGYYILETWRCGSSCISGVLADTRNGRIYNLPEELKWDGVGNSIDFRPQSFLLITAYQDPAAHINIRNYWAWDEGNKSFRLLRKK